MQAPLSRANSSVVLHAPLSRADTSRSAIQPMGPARPLSRANTANRVGKIASAATQSGVRNEAFARKIATAKHNSMSFKHEIPPNYRNRPGRAPPAQAFNQIHGASTQGLAQAKAHEGQSKNSTTAKFSTRTKAGNPGISVAGGFEPAAGPVKYKTVDPEIEKRRASQVGSKHFLPFRAPARRMSRHADTGSHNSFQQGNANLHAKTAVEDAEVMRVALEQRCAHVVRASRRQMQALEEEVIALTRQAQEAAERLKKLRSEERKAVSAIQANAMVPGLEASRTISETAAESDQDLSVKQSHGRSQVHSLQDIATELETPLFDGETGVLHNDESSDVGEGQALGQRAATTLDEDQSIASMLAALDESALQNDQVADSVLAHNAEEMLPSSRFETVREYEREKSAEESSSTVVHAPLHAQHEEKVANSESKNLAVSNFHAHEVSKPGLENEDHMAKDRMAAMERRKQQMKQIKERRKARGAEGKISPNESDEISTQQADGNDGPISHAIEEGGAETVTLENAGFEQISSKESDESLPPPEQVNSG